SRPIALTIPGRFFHTVRGQSRQTSLEQLRELGQLFLRSAMVVGDLYLRICGHVRSYDLDADEVAQVLREAGFPASRISEICRVSFAPAHIYTEFMCSGMSFRVALTKTRMYYEARRGDRRVKRRKLRRASARVIRLLGDAGGGPWEYRAKNYVLSVVATEHNKHCAYYYHWQGLLNYLVAHA
ncbi:MAG TPA: hypothetical protein VK846_14110, partial [Candidatus Limnocylindria bacterium]|nr:hypothetical protein [Candidatus Limnocylindria bacterium]